ncbi:hypothetical protein ACRAWF_07525 [Streptomyces sp. L7]
MLPLLGGGDEVLRPLWAGPARTARRRRSGASGWRRRAVNSPALFEEPGEDLAAPLRPADARHRPGRTGRPAACEWADAWLRSLAADPPVPRPRRRRDPRSTPVEPGRTDGRVSPLVAAELRRQITVLELLSGPAPGGLRQVLAVSTEGRRVLRAVVSRRARGQRA